MGPQIEMGTGNRPAENGRPGGNGDPPDRRGGEPPRENGNPGGGDGDSDLDDGGDGDDSSSSTYSAPGRRGQNPNMFMYYKGLQDHQAKKGNLNNLDKQEEMEEMDKHCH